MAISQEMQRTIFSLIEEASKELFENPCAEQVNVLLSESGKVYSFFRMGKLDMEQEKECVRKMAEDHAHIVCVVAKWQYDGVYIMNNIDGLETLKASLTQSLLELSPENADAYVPLRGESGISVRHLKDLCPPGILRQLSEI